jgi:hypothetical protein
MTTLRRSTPVKHDEDELTMMVPNEYACICTTTQQEETVLTSIQQQPNHGVIGCNSMRRQSIESTNADVPIKAVVN